MKLKTVYYPEAQEVEVDVSLEDITNCIVNSTDSVSEVIGAFVKFHTFMKAIPQDVIDKINYKQKALIYNGFVEQLERIKYVMFIPEKSAENISVDEV